LCAARSLQGADRQCGNAGRRSRLCPLPRGQLLRPLRQQLLRRHRRAARPAQGLVPAPEARLSQFEMGQRAAILLVMLRAAALALLLAVPGAARIASAGTIDLADYDSFWLW